MVDEPIDYRTSDMALVTYLRMEGFDVQDVILDESSTCYWYFCQEPEFLQRVGVFRNGDARVEPKEFNRMFMVTKKEMFALTDHLDIPRPA